MQYSLQAFADRHAELGTAVLWRDTANRYVFVLSGEKYGRLNHRRFYAAVGGHREPGEEWVQCTQREVREELGCGLTILRAAETWLVRSDDTVARVQIPDDPRPALLVEMLMSYGPKAGTVYGIVVYFAELHGPPFVLQKDEVLGLLGVTPAVLAEGLVDERTWMEMQAAGAAALTDCEGLSPNTLLRPVGTARALGVLHSRGVQIQWP